MLVRLLLKFILVTLLGKLVKLIVHGLLLGLYAIPVDRENFSLERACSEKLPYVLLLDDTPGCSSVVYRLPVGERALKA